MLFTRSILRFASLPFLFVYLYLFSFFIRHIVIYFNLIILSLYKLFTLRFLYVIPAFFLLIIFQMKQNNLFHLKLFYLPKG